MRLFRKEAHERKEEWLQSCREVKKKIKSAKEDRWDELLSSSISERKVGSLMKRMLKYCSKTNSPKKAMGRSIASNGSKANILVSHYVQISCHILTKEERDINLQTDKKKSVESPIVPDTYSCNFKMTLFKKAAAQMKRKGAQGPIDNCSSFITGTWPKNAYRILVI